MIKRNQSENQKTRRTNLSPKYKKTLLSLKKEAREELERRSAALGVPLTVLVENMLLKEHRYSPAVEAGISAYMEKHKCQRHDAIQDMLARGLNFGK